MSNAERNRVFVRPNGYSTADSGFQEVDDFPAARAIKEFGADFTYVLSGNCGEVQVAGDPNRGFSTPEVKTLDIVGDQYMDAGPGTLEVLTMKRGMETASLHGVTFVANSGSKYCIDATYPGQGELILEGCTFKPRADTWTVYSAVHIKGWEKISAHENTFTWGFREHGFYPVNVSEIIGQGNVFEGVGRCAWHLNTRAEHELPSRSGFVFLDNEHATACRAPGGGGGLFTNAGCMGRGVYIDNCHADVTEGHETHRPYLSWGPTNKGGGQWFMDVNGNPYPVWTNDQRATIEEEHGPLYATSYFRIANSTMTVGGAADRNSAIGISSCINAQLTGRIQLYGDEFGKAVLSMNSQLDQPNGECTFPGIQFPSEWPGWTHEPSPDRVGKLDGQWLSGSALDGLCGVQPSVRRSI